MIPNLCPYALVLKSRICLEFFRVLVPEMPAGCSGATHGIGEQVEGDFRKGRRGAAHDGEGYFWEGRHVPWNWRVLGKVRLHEAWKDMGEYNREITAWKFLGQEENINIRI